VSALRNVLDRLAWWGPFKALGDWHDNLGEGLFGDVPRCRGERYRKLCNRRPEAGCMHYPVPLCQRCFNYDPDSVAERFPAEAAEWSRRNLARSTRGMDDGVGEVIENLQAQAWAQDKRAFELIRAGRREEADAHQVEARRLRAEASRMAQEVEQAFQEVRAASRST
jgi:hypothetical protein